jgi:hypothetical protein
MKKLRGAGTRVCFGVRYCPIRREKWFLIYLELVLLGLSSRRGIEKIDGKNLKGTESA